MEEFITKEFDNPILYNPALSSEGNNSLKIITAFTDCERISTHMITLSDGMKANRYVKGIKVDIILGMTKTSLSERKHNEICRLIKYLQGTSGMPKINCHYVKTGTEVHSKIYVWGKENGEYVPKIAYCGSLNYTMNAFYKRRESVAQCDPQLAYMYYRELYGDTVNCLDPTAVERIKNVANATAEDAQEIETEDYAYYDNMKPVDTLNVSLLQANGTDTGYGSGINWGIRKNGLKRNPNQAYIPYNKQDKKQGFFPDRIHPDDKNCPIFRVITKDFGSFHMRMAQDNNKAIHTAESNAILGEWIRKKIGVPSGSYVTKQMLELYGKTYVVFRKYEDGTYLLDF